MKTKIFALLVLLIATSGCSVLEAGELRIIDIWAQATLLNYSENMSEHAYHIPVSSDSRLYFQVINEGDTEDALIGGWSEISEEMTITGPQGNRVRLAPGEKVVISPRSEWSVILRNVRQDLLPAQKIKVTLMFERQGAVEILVPIKLPQN